jgi:hypothetical protein
MVSSMTLGKDVFALFRDALEHAECRKLWFGNVVSGIGSGVTRLALPLAGSERLLHVVPLIGPRPAHFPTAPAAFSLGAQRSAKASQHPCANHSVLPLSGPRSGKGNR